MNYMTLEQVRDWHLAQIESIRKDRFNHGATLLGIPDTHQQCADAIDAHLAKAGEPVSFRYRMPDQTNGWTVFISAARAKALAEDGLVVEPLYAAPPITEPAQPVESVDAFTPIPEAVEAPTPELWRAYEAFNDAYKGFNTQQALRAAINGVLVERAALAHPRPTGDGTCGTCGETIRFDALTGTTCECATTVEQAGEVVEHIAQQWDGCLYEAVGEDIDIGEAIRAEAKRLAAAPAPGKGGEA